MASLSAEDFERSVTWHPEIARLIIPADTPHTDADSDRHWEEPSSLYLCRASGAYRWYARGLFGRNTLRFIQALHERCHQVAYTLPQAAAWLVSFLAQHPGTGPLEPELARDSETRRIAYAEWAKEIRAEAVDLPPDCDGWRYLVETRGLPGPWPLSLQWLANARPGEGALVAPLTAHNRVTGIQSTYVTPLATRSLVEPNRFRLSLEPGPAFIEIARREPGVVDIIADTIICEGLENGLSIARVKRPGWRIIALPGIYTLAGFTPERPGERIIVFQDSDPEGHPAREPLQRGIDALKLAGAVVRVTAFSELGDANAILRHEHGGDAAITRLLQTAAVAPLSFAREAERLAKLPPTEYEKARRRIAEEQGVRVTHLDREVSRLRPKPTAADTGTAGGLAEMPKDEPWPGPLPQLATMLDTAAAAMAAFLVAPAVYYDIIAVWSATSYLVQSEILALPIMPQLAFQSEGPESGKSTALELTATLCYRGILRSSYTGPTLFRRINEQQVTYCLSDLHTILTDPHSEIHAVIKACHRRAEAFVDRTEENSGGTRYVASYRCWAALAWASIGPMTPEMHSRAIVLPLQPALPEESAGLDHTSPSRSPVLIDVRRQLAAWGANVIELPVPTMPASLWSRAADNWRPLLAVAALAGGDWPQRMLTAFEEVRKIERRPDLRERLLTAIRDAFYVRAREEVRREADKARTPLSDGEIVASAPRPDTRIATHDLLDALNNDEESGLGEANRGRGITAYWLRDHLRGLLNPPGSRDWYEGSGITRKHFSGYEWHQFADTIRRHLPSAKGPDPSGASGTPGSCPSSTADLADLGVPDGESRSGAPSGAERSRESAPSDHSEPDAPDAPDAEGDVRKDVPSSAADDAAVDEVPPVIAENPAAEAKVPPPPAADPTATPTAAGAADGQGVPPPPVGDYTPGAIDAEIRRLHHAHPERSTAWLAKQTGQPPSYVRAVLGVADAGEQP